MSEGYAARLIAQRGRAPASIQELIMTTILVIVVLVLLLGGGGYGYSRWR